MNNGNDSRSLSRPVGQAEKRAFAQLDRADAVLKAALHGVVYDPLPRRVRFIIPRRNLRRALGLVALFLACSVAVILLVKW